MPDTLAPAAYRLRAELRTGWRFVVAAGLIVGIGAGLALVAASGARRTASAFDRLAEETSAADVLVLPESAPAAAALDATALASMAGVEDVGTAVGTFALTTDGDPIDAQLLVPIDRRAFVTIERPLVREGRLPDPTRADEVFMTPGAAAELGVAVGDRVELYVWPELSPALIESLGDVDFADVVEQLLAGEVGVRGEFRLVGTGPSVSGAVREREDSVLFTYAFGEATGVAGMYNGHVVHLAGGASVGDLQAELTAAAGSEPVSLQTLAAARATLERTLRPQVVALAILALVVALTTLGAWALLASRRARAMSRDAELLGGLGLSTGGRLAIAGGRAGLVALVAAAVAATVSVLGSAAMPWGEARRIEPHRGIRIDTFVLLAGLGALVACVIATGLAVAVRRRDRGAEAPRPGWQPTRWPEGAIGIAHALEGRRRPGSARALLGAACLAGVLMTTIGTFDRNLRAFVATPGAYGWNYELQLDGGNVDDSGSAEFLAALERALAAEPDVMGWANGTVLQGTIDGRPESLLGLEQRSGQTVTPTIVAGRAPERDGEVALGLRTAQRAGAAIGDDVAIGVPGAEHSFRVVGTAVLAPVAGNSTDAATLGGGAVVTGDGLRRALGLDETASAALLVDLVDGTDAAPLVERVAAAVTADGLEWGDIVALGPGLPVTPTQDNLAEPLEVNAYRDVQTIPRVLVSVIGLLTIATFTYLLAASARSSRREFAVLRALGFSSGQVGRAIVWQAGAIAVIAVAIGVPLGIVAGRWAWQRAASQLGLAPAAEVPWAFVAAALPLALAVAVVVALPTGRAAVRRPAAEALRHE